MAITLPDYITIDVDAIDYRYSHTEIGSVDMPDIDDYSDMVDDLDDEDQMEAAVSAHAAECVRRREEAVLFAKSLLFDAGHRPGQITVHVVFKIDSALTGKIVYSPR